MAFFCRRLVKKSGEKEYYEEEKKARFLILTHAVQIERARLVSFR